MSGAGNQRFDMSEAERRIANIVSIGKVEQADYERAIARVRVGSLLAPWLPMMALRAGPDVTWTPYEIGEQVVILSPSGDLASGVIIGSVYTSEFSAPSDNPAIERKVFSNGAVVEYDRENGRYFMDVKGNVHIVATGDVTVEGDVIADGVSLKHHVHGGVVAGGSNTDEPVQ